MVEETEANWRECIRKTIEMATPDSVTIYQMEIPFNTGIYQEMKAAGKLVAPVADWETKRAWVGWGFAVSWRRRVTQLAAPTRRSRTKPPRSFFTAIVCGRARI